MDSPIPPPVTKPIPLSGAPKGPPPTPTPPQPTAREIAAATGAAAVKVAATARERMIDENRASDKERKKLAKEFEDSGLASDEKKRLFRRLTKLYDQYKSHQQMVTYKVFVGYEKLNDQSDTSKLRSMIDSADYHVRLITLLPFARRTISSFCGLMAMLANVGNSGEGADVIQRVQHKIDDGEMDNELTDIIEDEFPALCTDLKPRYAMLLKLGSLTLSSFNELQENSQETFAMTAAQNADL